MHVVIRIVALALLAGSAAAFASSPAKDTSKETVEAARPPKEAVPAVRGVAPKEAWNALAAGNRRYVAGLPWRGHHDAKRRTEIAGTQHPIAIVVGCSDSRVPPEILFDQGLGDLFVIRNAGNVVDANALASIEYAAEHLGVRLIVVLGHERCGAVTAALDGTPLPGNLPALLKEIEPAALAAKGTKGDVLNTAICLNVEGVAREIAADPILEHLIAAQRLQVVTALYDLDTGRAEKLPEKALPLGAPPTGPAAAPGHH